MKYTTRIIFMVALCLVVPMLSTKLLSQEVVHHSQNNETLEQRWNWAFREATNKKFHTGFWIGYGITRLMGEHSYIGSFSMVSGRMERMGISLHELLYGQKEYTDGDEESDEEAVKQEAERSLKRSRGEKYHEQKVEKGVAILFAYSSTERKLEEPQKIVVSNLSLAVDLGERPLIWLGSPEQDEAANFLQGIYGKMSSTNLKERLLHAISIHENSTQSLPFLRNVLTSEESDKLRSQAAFLIGERNHDEDIALLLKVINTDRSSKVRDQAVFGLSRIESDAATDALINLTKEAENKQVRSKAIFWLSQKASEKVVPTLKNVIEKDSDVQVQREAVFALSRIKGGDGVNELIAIAKSNQNPEVRRQAIFWLGQSKDPRALDALVEMVKKK